MLRHTKGNSFISIFHIQYCVSTDSFGCNRREEERNRGRRKENVYEKGKLMGDRERNWNCSTCEKQC